MRVDYDKEFPAGVEAMAGLERAVRSGGLEPGLDGLDLRAVAGQEAGAGR